MAIVYRAPGVIACGPDAYGECIIAGKVWRWDFHHYLGPTFLRKDGAPLTHQPGERHPVWDKFAEWLTDYNAKRATAQTAAPAGAGGGE